MRINLISEKCQGHGRCYSLAPELFDSDDIGNSVLLVTGELTEDQLKAANLAAANCPEYAIEVGD